MRRDEEVRLLFDELLEEAPSSAQISKELAIEAIQNGENEEAIRELVRDGLVTPARRSSGKDIVERPLIRCDGDAVQAVIDERGEQ